jgi:hypothetical protein
MQLLNVLIRVKVILKGATIHYGHVAFKMFISKHIECSHSLFQILQHVRELAGVLGLQHIHQHTQLHDYFVKKALAEPTIEVLC